jgi:predicted DNA binding CopG/RHH family protein
MSKKSFKDNPALQFMSRPEEVDKGAREEKREEKAPEVREIKEVKAVVDEFMSLPPITFEAKSKRFNMLMRPSVFAKLKKTAEYRGTSVNDLINTIVESYMEFDGK